MHIMGQTKSSTFEAGMLAGPTVALGDGTSSSLLVQAKGIFLNM